MKGSNGLCVKRIQLQRGGGESTSWRYVCGHVDEFGKEKYLSIKCERCSEMSLMFVLEGERISDILDSPGGGVETRPVERRHPPYSVYLFCFFYCFLM